MPQEVRRRHGIAKDVPINGSTQTELSSASLGVPKTLLVHGRESTKHTKHMAAHDAKCLYVSGHLNYKSKFGFEYAGSEFLWVLVFPFCSFDFLRVLLNFIDMKAQAKHLRSLLEKICKATGQQVSHYGLLEASKKIDGISEKYLYKNIYYNIADEDDEFRIELSDQLLDLLAEFVGSANYREFVLSLEHPIDPTLRSAESVYWSYVRMNSSDSTVLCSPARIFIDRNSPKFELRGPNWTYRGNVRVEGGCLFISMSTDVGKSFHHVYKIGRALSPRILQGVFSGVSSAFDPIAGRCVLVRTDENYAEMKNISISVQALQKKPGEIHKALSIYFKQRSGNNLIIEGMTTNDLPDLRRKT